MAVEVGKMIGGWIKATRENQSPAGADKQAAAKSGEGSGQVEIQETFTCSECGAAVVKVVKEYSEKHMGMILCRKCQNRHKRRE